MMNEKIEKLAEQCGIIGGDIYEDRVVDYEKFAELIVKECIKYMLVAVLPVNLRVNGHIIP